MKPMPIVFFLAPLATLHAGRNLLEVPRFGKLCPRFFQSLEKSSATISNNWN
jgi:hypothetical protein